MNEKLTLEIAMLYPNTPLKNKRLGKRYQDFIDFFKSKQYECWVNQNLEVKIDDCKLILRPLKNSLVQAEKDYLLKTFLKPNDYDFDCLFFDEIEESIAFLLDILPFNMVAKLIDYLRSINIDIDGLQERGVAIYE